MKKAPRKIYFAIFSFNQKLNSAEDKLNSAL